MPTTTQTAEYLYSHNPALYFSPTDPKISRDLELLAARVEALNTHDGPRVGDFVIFPNGEIRRFTFNWGHFDGGIQTTSSLKLSESFFISKSGQCDYSGGMDSSLPLDQIHLTDKVMHGSAWFFSDDWMKAHNGVNVFIPFRVYEYRPVA